MSGVSSSNESFEEEGRAVVVMALPPSHPEDVPGNAPPLAPPLPPPLLLGDRVQKKRRVRSFYWKPIPEERVKQQDRPNLWTLGRHSAEPSFRIDVRAIEELFGQHNDTQSPAEGSGTAVRRRASVRTLREQITILDSKRNMNISIFLKHLKKSGEALLEDLLHGNSEACAVESLRALLKLLPEDEEVKNLQMFSGDLKDLTAADAFMYKLIHVPRYELRIEALLLKGEFFSSCSVIKQDITVVQMAITELLNCEELHNVLHLVLQAGNIMNAGGFAGNAVGFKLSSLLSLADTKANKPGMNLLHFVALEAQKNLLMFPEKLLHVQLAACVCVDSIHVELRSLSSRVYQIQLNIQTDDDLLTQLQSFLKSADEALVDLRACCDEMVNDGNTLIDFFCEDKVTFKLDECFQIFQNFCSKFKKAVQENVEREVWEESRRKRLKELEDKRHSWAGHEGVGGVISLRSSSETDVEAALKWEGLLDLLRTHPQSPHSPLLLFGSVRRSRQQKVDSQSTPDVKSDPSGADTHVLPPVHSLSITHTHTASDTDNHNDTNTHSQTTHTNITENHTDDSDLTNLHAEKSTSHNLPETKKDILQTHTQQFQKTKQSREVTFDLSQRKSEAISEHHNQSVGSTRALISERTDGQMESLKSSDRHTQRLQTNKKTLDPKQRSSFSAKSSPSSKPSSPAKSSPSSKPSSPAKSSPSSKPSSPAKSSPSSKPSSPESSSSSEPSSPESSPSSKPSSPESSPSSKPSSPESSPSSKPSSPESSPSSKPSSPESSPSSKPSSPESSPSSKPLFPAKSSPSSKPSSPAKSSPSSKPSFPAKSSPSSKPSFPAKSSPSSKPSSPTKSSPSSKPSSLAKSSLSSKPSSPESSPSSKPLFPAKSSPSSKPLAPAKSSSASPKTSHQRPVRTLTSSETLSMRKVVPISRSSSSGPQKHERSRSAPGAITSAKKRQAIRLPPEEKMCRATLRALATPAPQNPAHASQKQPIPSFARNTVSSTTRHAVAPADRSNQPATTGPKGPPLTRAASLRLGQRSPAVRHGKAVSVRLTSSAEHDRKSSSVLTLTSSINHRSQQKSVKPTWRCIDSVESSDRHYSGHHDENEHSLHLHPNHEHASYQAAPASIHCTHTAPRHPIIREEITVRCEEKPSISTTQNLCV